MKYWVSPCLCPMQSRFRNDPIYWFDILFSADGAYLVGAIGLAFGSGALGEDWMVGSPVFAGIGVCSLAVQRAETVRLII